MRDYVVVIPARYESTRFPGKPLTNILGKTMLQRTVEQCYKVVAETLVYVATDDSRVAQHCEEIGVRCIMTSPKCLTGTDRIAEFAQHVDALAYINVQGDEPVFNPNDLKLLIERTVNASFSSKSQRMIINGYTEIETEAELYNHSVPKVAISLNEELLYMSRSAIPGNKKGHGFNFGYRQVCLYSFSKMALFDFARYGKKTPFEESEDIEILRFLEMDCRVEMVKMSNLSQPVDNPQDVDLVKEIIKERNL